MQSHEDDDDSLERSFSSLRGNNGTKRFRHSNSIGTLDSTAPKVDSSILDTVILEPRDKFTLYKIVVNDGDINWVIYRRYGDFVLLNKKLRRSFPHFRVHLPGRRIWRDNFDKAFIDKRQQGLEEFIRNVLSHRDLVQSVHVQRFFRFDNPPQPHECLEASQAYAHSLEVSLASLRQKLKYQGAEITGLKTEIAREKYQPKSEQANLSDKDQKYLYMVEDATKALKEQLHVAQENERKAKDELTKLREEIKAERASEQAARYLDREKRDLQYRNDLKNFHQIKEESDSSLNELTSTVSKMTHVRLGVGDKTYEVKADDGISKQLSILKKALDESRLKIENLHSNGLDIYRQIAEDLKADLQREAFQSEMRIKEANELRQQLEQQHQKFVVALKKQDDYIREVGRSLTDIRQYATATEEKYFYSLVIGVKLNMAARGNRVININQLNPMTLFERVTNRGISIEHWPSWVSRELATASSCGEDTLT